MGVLSGIGRFGPWSLVLGPYIVGHWSDGDSQLRARPVPGLWCARIQHLGDGWLEAGGGFARFPDAGPTKSTSPAAHVTGMRPLLQNKGHPRGQIVRQRTEDKGQRTKHQGRRIRDTRQAGLYGGGGSDRVQPNKFSPGPLKTLHRGTRSAVRLQASRNQGASHAEPRRPLRGKGGAEIGSTGARNREKIQRSAKELKPRRFPITSLQLGQE
jgi:hypothetical protein